MLSARQVADLLDKDVRTLRRWRREGRGPVATRVENTWMYADVDVLRYLNHNRGGGDRRGA